MKKIIVISFFSRSILNQDPIKGCHYGWHGQFARQIKSLDYEVEVWTIDIQIKRKAVYRKKGITYAIFPVSFYFSLGREFSLELIKAIRYESAHSEIILHLFDFHNWQAYIICNVFKNIPIVGHFLGATNQPIKKLSDPRKWIFMPLLLFEQMMESLSLKYIDYYLLVNTQDAYYIAHKLGKPYKFCPMVSDLKLFYPIKLSIARKLIGINQKIPMLLFVGDLNFQKDIKFLLISFAKIIHRKLAVLYIVGSQYDGRYYNRVVKLINKLGLEKYVRLKGFVPRQKLNFYYNAADALMVTSKKEEGGPTVILEALATGTPVVSLRTGFINDIENKANNLLKVVENRDSVEFANSVILMISRPKAHIENPLMVWALANTKNTVSPIYKNLFSKYYN